MVKIFLPAVVMELGRSIKMSTFVWFIYIILFFVDFERFSPCGIYEIFRIMEKLKNVSMYFNTYI